MVGASNIVGRPMALEMMLLGATATVCHSRTRDLAEHCRRADILIAAIGKPRFITADMIKPGASCRAIYAALLLHCVRASACAAGRRAENA